MKKISSAVLLFTLLVSTFLPVFGQKSRGERTPEKDKGRIIKSPPVVADDFAKFSRLEAFSDGSGVLVQWQMISETDNTGFMVYRVDSGTREVVGDGLVLGSAAKLRKQTLYGEKYEIFDPLGGFNSKYVIEASGPSGRTVSSESFSSKYTYDLGVAAGQSRESIQALSENKNGVIEKTEPVLSNELRKEIRASAQAADLTAQRAVVAQAGAKIAVKKDGLYRVRLTALPSNVFNSGNSANWKLFRDGVEQAILIGSDANGLYLEFYGRAFESVESNTAIYYLIAGSGTGKRIGATRLRGGAGSGDSPSYGASVEKKERTTYATSIFNGDAENFWGRFISSSPTSISVTMTGVDFSQLNTTVNLKVQGWGTSVNTPQVNLIVNGRAVGTISGVNNQTPFSGQFTMPTSFLNEGANNIQLTSGGLNDFSFFDSVKFSYARTYVAESQNKLLFTSPNAKRAVLSGFKSANIRLFDVTTDGNPVLLSNPVIQQNGGTYNVRWPAARSQQRKIFAVEETGVIINPTVTVNNPSDLATTSRSADYIIISDSATDFMAAANTWAAYRESAAGGSFNAEVVDVADIYDEYSYGSASSTAIKEFLSNVKVNWPSQVPNRQYVLLIGDASSDPKNYLGKGEMNLVPAKQLTTIYSETYGDDGLADFDGDGLTDMAIGRIPARTAAEVSIVFNKTVAFETPAMQSMSRGAIFAYDLPDGYDFADLTQTLSSQAPPAMPKTMVPRVSPGYPNGQPNLISTINSGSYLVNYSGHGSAGAWGNTSGGTFFSKGAVPLLHSASDPANPSDPSVFMMLTCWNGYYVHPDASYISIAELLLLSQNSGAVVAWASSGETTADGQMQMGGRFLTQLSGGNPNLKRVGDLIRDSKSVLTPGSDVLTTWALLGDPGLKMIP
ncbi:MAG: C25 family cysteine peptidase [Pyrinomonadaceae bacterium]